MIRLFALWPVLGADAIEIFTVSEKKLDFLQASTFCNSKNAKLLSPKLLPDVSRSLESMFWLDGSKWLDSETFVDSFANQINFNDQFISSTKQSETIQCALGFANGTWTSKNCDKKFKAVCVKMQGKIDPFSLWKVLEAPFSGDSSEPPVDSISPAAVMIAAFLLSTVLLAIVLLCLPENWTNRLCRADPFQYQRVRKRNTEERVVNS